MSAALPKPGAPYQVPPEPNRWPSIGMAAAVHAALLAFLWIGVSWQSTEPVSVEAEVWDMKTQAAAPPEPTPTPVEQVAPPPEPEPLPAPKVAPPPAPPVEVKDPPKPPDIALEREKQRKLQREEERKERELAEREEQKRQDLADKKAREKAEKLAEKKAQELADKKAQALADKKAKELADKLADKKDLEKLAAEKKKAAEKLAKAKDAAENKTIAAMREAELRRMTGQAGNGTNGTAAKSTAPRSDSGYVASITSAIKSRSSYAGDTEVPGNPKVVFHVEQLPTGEIISVRKTKSSGIPEFDRAVENAINKSSPLPKKKDGTVERSLEVGFSMKDLN
ncbi:cell envelope integrity protein TolA [Massilia sp. S19_KUP03_FR1]|uniref:cell envelope integrity protein TolA n=1 Tax=Massilia sp. S19_KUP03_FR1 TaxID=3025503 RepID=UPI002FCD07B4